MTVLSENIKTLRKKIECTQKDFSKLLEIGFRTYVRYEAGERDVPVSVIVKLARLGNVSLDQLLTTKILPEDLFTQGQRKTQSTIQNPMVISGGIQEGRLMFKGFLNDNLITKTKNEQKLITLFRKAKHMNRDKFLMNLEWFFKNTRRSKSTNIKKISRKTEKEQTTVKLKKLTKEIKKITVRG